MVGRSARLLVILLGVVALPIRAAELRRLTLTDGSVISGEIESVQGGNYTVRSPSLGTITVKDSEIRTIETSSGAAATQSQATAPSLPSTNSQLDAVQHRLLSDDSIMSSVAALQDDPQFQDVVNDSDVMEALRTGNIDALERNPKVQRLMDDPRVQEINRKLPH
jgi:hypothetical protein